MVTVDVDLLCLSCSRERTVSVATLAALPAPEACTVCGGSIVVTGWSNRVVRPADEPFDWNEGKPKVGRPLSRRLQRTREDEQRA